MFVGFGLFGDYFACSFVCVRAFLLYSIVCVVFVCVVVACFACVFVLFVRVFACVFLCVFVCVLVCCAVWLCVLLFVLVHRCVLRLCQIVRASGFAILSNDFSFALLGACLFARLPVCGR